MPTQLKIKDGPDRLKLAFALFGGDRAEQLSIYFTTETPISGTRRHHVKLDSVEREDGTGMTWNLTGRMLNYQYPVKIFYDLRDRSGIITLT